MQRLRQGSGVRGQGSGVRGQELTAGGYPAGDRQRSDMRNGMALSREYFFEVAEPLLKRDFPTLYPRLAAGLVGNGSECFGYDDELSRDHDWGVDFHIWTGDDDAGAIPALRSWKSELLDAHPPRYPRARSEYGAHIGVMTCGDFYSSLIGAAKGPQNQKEWLRVPEENLALAVNGGVYLDGTGEFVRTREYLLGYYPEDIRLKKISAKCMALAQTGQYNYDRTAKRGDPVTLTGVLSRYIDAALAMTFLLNRVYKPYYKWAHRAARDLPILGADTTRLLSDIAGISGIGDDEHSQRKEYITELCALFTDELRRQNLSSTDDWFMTTHGEEVRQKIKDDFLRSLPAQYEI